MKIKIEKENLVKLLSLAQNIVEKKISMPILSNILLVAQKDHLEIFATDLEVSLTDKVPVKVLEEGKAAVSAKSLYEIIRELPSGYVTLEKQDNHWVKIHQNKSVFNIVGVAPDEYPVFPTFVTKSFMKVSPKVLLEMIEKTIYSVSTDETRYHLNGVYFERFDENKKQILRMVATDGHRLSLVEKPAEATEGTQLIQGVIIPRKGVHEIRKLIENGDSEAAVEIAVEGSQLVVKNSETVLMVRLIEGKYPNYRQLIPQNLPEELVVNKDILLSSLRRVSLLSNQKSKGVTLKLSMGKLQITSNNPELGDATEELEVAYKGKDLKIGFNARYILDVLSNIEKEEVNIELKDQLSPGLVRPHDDTSYTCVVMPMRI